MFSFFVIGVVVVVCAGLTSLSNSFRLIEIPKIQLKYNLILKTDGKKSKPQRENEHK